MMITLHLLENIKGKEKLLNDPKENSWVQKSSNLITKFARGAQPSMGVERRTNVEVQIKI